MRKWTKRKAADMVRENIEKTGYSSGDISIQSMYEMLRCRMGFGNAEAKTILSALVLAGAKFKYDDNASAWLFNAEVGTDD